MDSLRVHLDHFLRWFGENQPITEVNAAVVRRYYEHVLAEARKSNISKYYARDLFASFHQWVRWIAEQDLIPVPKNLLSRDFGFKLTSRPLQTFSDNEVKLLLAAASDRTRLYMLLMLNTGMTQGDVAELPKSRVDLVKNQITHKRYKTESHDDVPTVVYPLWEPTAALLKKHLNPQDSPVNRHGEPLALVSTEGKPLLAKELNAKGKLTKKDAIRSAYNRVATKVKNNGTEISGSLKTFRKTAASKLEEHPTYGRYVVHFLGQSAKTIAGKYYVTPSQEQFTAAVRWLGEQWVLD